MAFVKIFGGDSQKAGDVSSRYLRNRIWAHSWHIQYWYQNAHCKFVYIYPTESCSKPELTNVWCSSIIHICNITDRLHNLLRSINENTLNGTFHCITNNRTATFCSTGWSQTIILCLMLCASDIESSSIITARSVSTVHSQPARNEVSYSVPFCTFANQFWTYH
jgi:hypothetical protein